MAFRKALIVPEKILEIARDKPFLHKEDLKRLVEADLLFFLRTKEYHILDDYPCMGAFERRLLSSRIEGPFEEAAPEIEQQEGGYSESQKDILRVLIPSNRMPVNFQAVTYVNYGTTTDADSQRHLGLATRNRINPDEIWMAGNRILANLRKKQAKVKQTSDSHCTTTIEACLVEFNLAKSRFYPLVEISIFGRGETPLRLMRELDVYRIRGQFPSDCQDVSIRSATRRGVAYNLSLNGKRSIADMLRSENVVI